MEKVKFDVDNIEDAPMVEIPKHTKGVSKTQKKTAQVNYEESAPSCLRNERIEVRFVPKASSNITNKRHVLYGGMAEGAKLTLVVPRLSTGVFVNVLTDAEKDFLEECMGLEKNALSVYKKPDIENFWCDANNNGINRVTLMKGSNYLDLSDPQDYIKYKILLANKNIICPSLTELERNPKATYKFVIVGENEESRNAKNNMTYTMSCYKEFGKVEENIAVLRTVIETLDGRPTAQTSKLEFLQNKCNELIQSNPKKFLSVIQDPMLTTKVLIKQCMENGYISNRGNYLYLRSDNTPLCEQGEEPTLAVAAKFLNSPKHQDILFALQAKLNS